MEQDKDLNNYEKKKIAIRYWLEGKAEHDIQYYNCLKAMELAMKYHTGLRKDGFTPEFQHQIEIVSNLRLNVKNLLNPADTITVAFLHDLVEDYGIGSKYWETQKERLEGLKPVTLEFIRKHFGETVMEAVDKISKMADGVSKSKNTYFKGISECPIASIDKLEDRDQNLDSMLNAFTMRKQLSYCDEVVDHFLPMAKVAARNFPEQAAAYLMLKNKLISKVKAVRGMSEIFIAQGLDLDQIPIQAARKARKMTA